MVTSKSEMVTNYWSFGKKTLFGREQGDFFLSKKLWKWWSIEVTTCKYGDAEMLQPLLDQIDEPIASVTADGAYDTVNCYDAIRRWS